MMQKLKITGIVVGLLLTGFVAGFLTNRQLVQRKIHNFHRMEAEQGFGQLYLERIGADAAQTATLQPILDDYGQRFRTMRTAQSEQRRAFGDSLRVALAPHLTDDQLQTTQKWLRMMAKGPRKPRHDKK